MSLTMLRACFSTIPKKKKKPCDSFTHSITSECLTSFSLFLELLKICLDLRYTFTYHILFMSPMTAYMLMLLSKLNTFGKILSEIQSTKWKKGTLILCGSGGRWHGCTCGWSLLMYDRKWQNSVKQLSFN